VYNMRGGTVVAGNNVQAQLGAALEGTESMEHTTVATHLGGMYIPGECISGIQARDE